MRCKQLKVERFVKRVIALVIIIGALPFLNSASAYAGELRAESQELRAESQELRAESREPRAESQELRAESREPRAESRWLDDYHAKVGLTYNAQARIQTSYLWRGLYAGGANIQASANVGYGGLYFDMWWNIGVTDWTFKVFEPEVDLSLGFARWGLDVFILYIHNFNCPFFDFGNYPDKGNRLELNVHYTVSSKLPLSILWATRVGASDGYRNEAGEWVQAYSSYLELSYTQKLRDGFSIYGAIGMTPWKGVYNPNGAALQNIELRLRKDWSVAQHCGVMLQAQMAVSPMQPINVINLNATFGVYLK